MRRRLFIASCLSLAGPGPALAAEGAQVDDTHVASPPDIIVTAPFNRDRAAVLAGTSVLSGEALTRDVRTTIGDTLAKLPGVSSTSFGPNASRPILRGFQGERVRVLKDGIGSVDVSNTSVDHPVVVNPLTAERIEVIRGPSALLYGSAAIGGVVNVIDGRIPRRVPHHGVHTDATATYGSAAEERSVFGQFDVALGAGFVAHVDGSYVKTNDLDTGNFILSAPLRAQAATSADPAIAALATLKGKLPNSAARTWETAAGVAYVADGGTLGVSFSHYDNLYGVPVRFSLDPAAPAEQVRIAARQDRADLRAEINVRGAFIDTIRFRSAFADYKHSEIDASGAIGTTFLNKSNESRLEFAQAKRGQWRGAFGAQLAIRDFNVIGNEAFLPKNATQQFGLFTLQELDAGAFKAEGGARFERTNVTAAASRITGNADLRSNFSAFSASLGASYAIASEIRAGLTASHTERAPAAEELFANGPHAGTQAFEIGNPDFGLEKSNGLEASLRGSRRDMTFSLAVYHDWFSNFIYEDQTGAIRNGLPVFQLRQADARYWGAEGEIAATVFRTRGWTIKLDAVGDYTNATITGAGPAPRIPPLRLLGAVEGNSDRIDLRAEAEWTAPQRRVAPFETATPGFTLVNASATLRPFGKTSRVNIVIAADNIFNAAARRHSSFLKDYAPLAGRDIRITTRISL